MTRYFTIKELTRSEMAEARGIDNNPNSYCVDNLEILVRECLDKIRELYGDEIYVNSGYRSEKLNKLVGGSRNSYHLYGQAADITTGDKKKNLELFKKIIDSDIQFTSLINEYKGSWIHIAYDRNNLVRRVRTLP